MKFDQGKYPTMNMKPIFNALGDDSPEITNKHGHPTPLGRFRLVKALQNKYGDNFKNHPKAKAAIGHFDEEHKYFQKLRKIRGSM